MREAFRLKFTDREVPGLDVVVLAKRQASQTENRKLFQSLNKHWLIAQKHAKNPD